MILTDMQFRNYMNCSVGTLKGWREDGMPSFVERGQRKYDLQKCQEWFRHGWFDNQPPEKQWAVIRDYKSMGFDVKREKYIEPKRKGKNKIC